VTVVVALMLAVSAGVGTLSLVRAADPPGQNAVAPAAKADASAVTADDHPPMVASLKNGVSIEVVGVAPSPSAGKPMWRADGSVLPLPVYAKLGGQSTGPGGPVMREVTVRVNDLVGTDGSLASVRWSIPNSSGWAGGNPQDARGRDIPDLEVRKYTLEANAAAKGLTVRADVAAGPWKTRFQANEGGSVAGVGKETFHFSPVFEVDGRAAVIFVHGGASERFAARVVAVDRNGQERVARIRQMVTSGGIVSGEYSLPVARKDLKELLYQTRPYDQWIEIRNVCVDPTKPTKVEVVSSDTE
jgi:hypothetical protein